MNKFYYFTCDFFILSVSAPPSTKMLVCIDFWIKFVAHL